MADFSLLSGSAFARNLGYQRSTYDLGQRTEYLNDPNAYLEAQKKAITLAATKVENAFDKTVHEFQELGYSDAKAKELATEHAKNVANLEDVKFNAQFPEVLFSDAKRRIHGEYEMKYGKKAAKALVGKESL